MFVYNLTACMFWYMVAWVCRFIMFFTYKRIMLLMAGVAAVLVWYDYHELQLVLYAMSGMI